VAYYVDLKSSIWQCWSPHIVASLSQ